MRTGPAAALLLLPLFLGSTGVAPGAIHEGTQHLAEGFADGQRVVRIGLENAHAVRVSSKKPFRIIDPETGRPVWKDSYSGFVAVVGEGGPAEAGGTIYRIQAGAFSTEDAAETERSRLERVYSVPAKAAYVADRGSWRVRVGEAREREALGPLVDRLRADGVEGVWITEEPVETAGSAALRLVDASYDARMAERPRVVAVPGGSHLEIEGKPYRGIVEFRIDKFGLVRPINWVGAESYLNGVVPAELGPEIWPQLEALKAQAVAARTYLYKNLGQFDEDGYDLCATPRCQVYSGVSAEHPLSDRAVAGTRGEILQFEGKPISALYTATCGGHTENGFEIFPEEKGPYLKGVPCRAEAAALATLRGRVEGRAATPRVIETGADVTRDWALLAAAGVLDEASDAAAPAAAAELSAWMAAAGKLAGRTPAKQPAADATSLAVAAVALVEGMGWGDRARVLLAADDLPALLRDPEAAGLGQNERRALAVLVQAGALQPLAGGTFGVSAPVSRGRMAAALARICDTYDAFSLREASIADVQPGRLRFVQGKGALELALAKDPFLFSLGGERAVPAKSLELWPGDRVRYRTDASGRIAFLELRPPVKGSSDDRFAKVYSWETRITRAELEEAIRRRLDVGKVQALDVVRRGVSGRIVELRVKGERGSSVVKGFDVRTLLGLRESLTVVEIQRDSEGEIAAVVFAGKGWGHGVGLCQVGAYGMALRGATYGEILGHYYPGATLETVP